jgi:hypothetical protein
MAQLAVHLRAHVAAKNELLLKKKAESSGNIARQHLRLFLVGSAKFHCETHLRLAYTNRVLCLAQILLMDKLVLYTFAPFRNSTYNSWTACYQTATQPRVRRTHWYR